MPMKAHQWLKIHPDASFQELFFPFPILKIGPMKGKRKEKKFLYKKKQSLGWIQESLNEKMSVSYGGYY